MNDEYKDELQETVEAASTEMAIEGVEEVIEGAETLDAAADFGMASRVALAAGASDVTRGIDAMAIADRAAVLSEAVGVAGITDISEGADLLATSDDIAVQSAIVGSMSEEDLALGMQLASIAGQLEAVGDVADILGLPVMSAFLDSKSDELQDLSVDTILR